MKNRSSSKEGNFTYYSKNDGLQNQSVMYRKDAAGKEEIFLDPNTFKDGTTSLGGIDFQRRFKSSILFLRVEATGEK
jgi:prolyl oligopeptidase